MSVGCSSSRGGDGGGSGVGDVDNCTVPYNNWDTSSNKCLNIYVDLFEFPLF